MISERSTHRRPRSCCGDAFGAEARRTVTSRSARMGEATALSAATRAAASLASSRARKSKHDHSRATARHRLPECREQSPQRADQVRTAPLHRCPAPFVGNQGLRIGQSSSLQARHPSGARHALSVALAARGAEIRRRWQASPWPSASNQRDRGSHRVHRHRVSLVWIHSHSRRSLQSRP